SCCCQVQSLSWVPVRPPIAAVSIATLCLCATFRSPHTAGVFHFFCHRVLLADYGPPIAAARPLISQWPLLPPSSCCCQVQSLSWVPVRPTSLLLSPSPPLCHVPLSGLLTLLVCSIF
ncbi:unnamed protein product, partial [Staurois parvus]